MANVVPLLLHAPFEHTVRGLCRRLATLRDASSPDENTANAIIDAELATASELARVPAEDFSEVAEKLAAVIAGIRSADGWVAPADLAILDSALDECCDLVRLEAEEQLRLQAASRRASRIFAVV